MQHSWIDPAELASERLAEARLATHFAAWIVGSTAYATLPVKEDDSQTNLGWRAGDGSFVSHELKAGSGIVLALHVASLTLSFRRADETLRSLPLAGETLETALAWASGFLAEGLAPGRSVVLREYPDFPSHELAEGAAFQPGDEEARVALGHWFSNAQLVLARVLEGKRGASPLRTWPHHFDMGALIELGSERGLGLGMSPGDENRGEPYFYAYAFPSPKISELHPFDGAGEWTTEGFQGAVLAASEIASKRVREDDVETFFGTAMRQLEDSLRD